MTEIESKKNKIYNATLSIIETKGIQATSISAISKLAGVAQGTIYLYFKNKQDLLNQLYLEIKKKLTEVAFENFRKEKNIKLSFKIIWFNIARFKSEFQMEASFLNLCDNYPIIDKEYREKGIALLTPLIDLWNKGIKEKVIKDVSHYLLYGFTIYPINFIVNPATNKHCQNNLEPLLDKTFEMSWNSIKF